MVKSAHADLKMSKRPSMWRPFRKQQTSKEETLGLAEYMIVSQGEGWSVLHDGDAQNNYATKEAAFEAAVAAASLAIREGHEVHVSAPGSHAGNRTALGGADPR